VLTSPRDRSETGPEGTLALRRLLAASGRDVSEGETLPGPPGTFVLLSDFRDERRVSPIADWVRSGGRLFLADPGSIIVEALGIEAVEVTEARRVHPGCAAAETRGVRTVDSGGGAGFVVHDPAGIACFAHDGLAMVVTREVGRGRVVVLGDRTVITNEFLREEDNAIFVLQAIPADGPVVFGPPVPIGAATPGQGVWKSLPTAARVCIIELGIALIAFAVWRGRRLGRPVPEDPLVPIPAGELVRATGRLLRTARATPYAGGELRRAMIGRFSRRAGTPAASAQELAMVLARAGAGTEEELARVLAGPEPQTDDDLIALGREIEQLRRRADHVDEGGR